MYSVLKTVPNPRTLLTDFSRGCTPLKDFIFGLKNSKTKNQKISVAMGNSINLITKNNTLFTNNIISVR